MQSIDQISSLKNEPIRQPLDCKELTEILIKHYDLHEGKYYLKLNFQIGTGLFGPASDAICPTAMIGISKFGLMESVEDTPITIDAAKVNPPKPKKAVKKKED
jgi:hypothetical protein